mmetsp:Transcript_19445/g.43213  ORF Transcript_19445/g.43213 Transcript_19445/m.43213 type:complete len:511 (-) Transcript_19445:309-1841(-)
MRWSAEASSSATAKHLILPSAVAVASFLPGTTICRGEEVAPVSVSVTDANGVEIIGRTTSDGLVDAFLGIQYASIPERFAPSEALLDPPVGGTNETNEAVDASEFGPWCIQSWSFGPPVEQSEDCLSLNVWRPSNVAELEFPPSTMVWIHGGGFVAGSSSEDLYDGTTMVREEGIILVSINYRLAAFGFLVTGDGGMGGHHGINDQINALRWLNRHISAFGGDPADVTVFGESAGGVSVCLLCVSPLAAGLFRRAIIQSGQCISDRLGPLDPEEGAAMTQSVLDAAGVDSVSGLVNLTTDEVVAASAGRMGTSMISNPTIDGWVMPAHPSELYQKEGAINPTDLVVGATTYDDPTLLGIPPGAYIGRSTQFDSYVHGLFDEDYGTNASDAVIEAYSFDRYNGSSAAALAQFTGDFFFRCFGRELAAIAADNIDGTAYLYVFGHLAPGDISVSSGLLQMARIEDPTWASHTAEIPFVFGNLNETYTGPATIPPTDAEVTLSKLGSPQGHAC